MSRTPYGTQLFRLVNEVAFALVGALLLWVALFGRYLFNPRRPAWLVLTAVLILWGVRAWRSAARITAARERLATRIGAGSLVLAGLVLLSLSWAPFNLAGWLLAAAGAIFILRGLAIAALMARSAQA